jgi:Leucine-rich repeat (LRR) protein
MLLSHCDLRTVWKVKGAEGFGNIWSAAAATTPGSGAGASAMHDWSQLRNLNLSHCGLSALPPAVGAVSALRILRVSYNKLSALPAELQALSELEVLAADHNQLTSIPGGGSRGDVAQSGAT